MLAVARLLAVPSFRQLCKEALGLCGYRVPRQGEGIQVLTLPTSHFVFFSLLRSSGCEPMAVKGRTPRRRRCWWGSAEDRREVTQREKEAETFIWSHSDKVRKQQSWERS